MFSYLYFTFPVCFSELISNYSDIFIEIIPLTEFLNGYRICCYHTFTSDLFSVMATALNVKEKVMSKTPDMNEEQTGYSYGHWHAAVSDS
jgi:hypothetical protein